MREYKRPRKCAVCGKKFLVPPMAPHKLYCGPRCQNTAQLRRYRERKRRIK